MEDVKTELVNAAGNKSILDEQKINRFREQAKVYVRECVAKAWFEWHSSVLNQIGSGFFKLSKN